MKNYILTSETNHGHRFEFDNKDEAIQTAIKKRKRSKNGYNGYEKIDESDRFAEYHLCFYTERENAGCEIYTIWKRS